VRLIPSRRAPAGAAGTSGTAGTSGAASLRGRLAWSATAVVAGWVALLTLVGNLALGTALDRQADDAVRVRAEAVAVTVRVSPAGTVTVDDARDDRALDAGTWIFAADGSVVEAPPGSTAGLDRQAAALAGRGPRTADSDDGDLRLFALPVEVGGRQAATVVAATSLAPYRGIESLTVLGSLVLAAALLLAVHLVLRANVGRALRPVAEMSGQAARWGAEDTHRRFGPAPRPAELAELARTLDQLLDRLAAGLRRERQLVDELSHELRTPLARIQVETDLLRSRVRDHDERERAYLVIDAAAGSMIDIIETLMHAARAPHAGIPGRTLIAGALERVAGETATGAVTVRTSADPDLAVAVDASLLDRLLAPVLVNAVRHARASVVLAATATDEGVEVVVTDDGPGVSEALAEAIFEPGFRGNGADGHDGAGLGLPLARRLAVAAGGTVVCRTGCGGGVFVVRLPRG
jgi:signal transduction histidine kinase